MAENRIFAVDTGYAYFGLVVDDQSIVVDAAPIAKWAIGKDIAKILQWNKIISYKEIN